MRKNMENNPAAMKKKQRGLPISIVTVIIIIIMFCGCMLFLYSKQQTTKIRQMLNDSAYNNVQNTLTNLESAISNEFEHNYKEVRTLASGCSGIDDVNSYIKTLEFPSDISEIYYAKADENRATGYDGQILNLKDFNFKEKYNGVSRSDAYMNTMGDFSYIVKAPIKRNQKITGYLCVEYSMKRFEKLMPRDERIEGNNYSIMVADTMRYVYTPTGGVAGSHINFNRL